MLKKCIIFISSWSILCLVSCSKYDLSAEQTTVPNYQDTLKFAQNDGIVVHFHNDLSDQYFGIEILDKEQNRIIKVYKAATAASISFQELIPTNLDSFYLYIPSLPFLDTYPNDSLQVIDIFEANGKSTPAK